MSRKELRNPKPFFPSTEFPSSFDVGLSGYLKEILEFCVSVFILLSGSLVFLLFSCLSVTALMTLSVRSGSV